MRPLDSNSPLEPIRVGAGDGLSGNKFELEWYPAPGVGPHRFALVCPGGGYFLTVSSIEGLPYVRELNKRGYTAFVLRYRCRELACGGAPVEDAALAVSQILSNASELGVLTEGYSVWGSSAGGHVAACFGTESLGWKAHDLPRPAALVLCYPVVTMGDATHAGSRENLLGPDPVPADVDRWSVERQVTSGYPPTFVWNSETDDTVPPVNSLLLAKALKANGVPYEYLRYSSGKHGCGLDTGGPCDGWFDRAVTFWEAHQE